MFKAIADRPWIWIIVGSLFMLGAMVAFIVIAEKHNPQSVPLEEPTEWTHHQ